MNRRLWIPNHPKIHSPLHRISPLRISSTITCIHHHPLSFSVPRPSPAFRVSVSSISRVVILMLSGLQHARSFLFSTGSFPSVRLHPHSSISIPNCRFTRHSNRPISDRLHTLFPFPSDSTPYLVFPENLSHSFLDSFRCVSHQSSLIVFDAFGRMCSSYHRARKYANNKCLKHL